MVQRRRTAVRAWQVYALASVVPLALYSFLPPGPRAVLFDALAVGAGLAVLVGIRLNRPARALPWILLAIAQFAWALGDVTWEALSLGMGLDPFPSVADVAYLAGYPLAAAGLLLLVREVRASLDWRAAADTAIVVLAVGSIGWVALVDPVIASGAETPLAFAISLAYPVGDLVLIGLVVPLVAIPRRPPFAAVLLAASLGVAIVGDALFALTTAGDPTQNLVNLLYIVSYTFWGASALHPSMVDIPGEVPGSQRRLTTARIVGLLVALSVPVVILLAHLIIGNGVGSAAVILAYPAIALLAFLRLSDLVRAMDRQDEVSRTIIDRSADAIFLVGGSPPSVHDANEAASALLGRPHDALVGTPISTLVPPEELARQSERVAVMRRLGTPVLAVFQMVRADGSTVDVEMNEQATPDGGIVGVARDVGARKRAEAERARLVAALEQTPDMVVIADIEGRVLFVNQAFERALGVTLETLAGQYPVALLEMLHLDPRDRQFVAALEAGRPWLTSVQIRRVDGGPIDVNVAISRIRGPDGAPVGVVALGRDVTEQRLLEAQLRQAQKMEAVGQLAGGMAHDFNNLLTAIRGYAEMIRDAGAAGEPASEDDVEQILRAADRASGLTRQMLQFARRQRLEARAVDAAAVVEQIASLVRTLVGEQVKVVISGTGGTVMADPAALEQVVVNLALNARDAMPEGGVLTLDVGTIDVAEGAGLPAEMSPGPYVRVSVSDTGTGMDATVRSRAFEPFFTTKGPGRGTGMGLATVYGLVKQSLGFVYIESEPGQGARVDVYLPRIADVRPVAKRTAEPAAAIAGGDETILLVEDEEAVRSFARRVLEGRGYRVIEASSGVDALRVAEACTAPFDLLVTDVVMPKMGGGELAQRLRAGSPGLRVLFVSGFADRGVGSVGGLVGDGPLLSKPFSGDALAAAARAVLDAAPAGQPAAPDDGGPPASVGGQSRRR